MDCFRIHKFTDNSSGPDDSETYTANAEGRLASFQKNSEPAAAFTYDHTSERAVTQIRSRTITDLVDNAIPTGYSQVLKRTDTGGQSFTNIIGDDLLAQQTTAGLNHLLYDGHGSTRLLYTSEIDEAYDYDAYGNPVGFNPALTSTNYLYTGEQADLALGDSYYLRARFYMPGPGMFTSLDPYFGDTGEPQSLHKYAYVHGDPANAWDPTGMIQLTLSSVTFNISLINYVGVSAASYGIGKILQAGILIGTGQGLARFRWLEWWDLLALIPGGFIGGAIKHSRLPQLLGRAGSVLMGAAAKNGIIRNLTGGAVGAAREAAEEYLRLGGTSGRILFRAKDGTNAILDAGGASTGLTHILRRHVVQFWSGGDEVAKFWPRGTDVHDIQVFLSEAMQHVDTVSKSVHNISLRNGIDIRLIIDPATSRIVSFFPVGGSGVLQVDDLVRVAREFGI